MGNSGVDLPPVRGTGAGCSCFPCTLAELPSEQRPNATLPQALTSNSGLQSLLLDTNALGDEGAAMLATVRALPAVLAAPALQYNHAASCRLVEWPL